MKILDLMTVKSVLCWLVRISNKFALSHNVQSSTCFFITTKAFVFADPGLDLIAVAFSFT